MNPNIDPQPVCSPITSSAIFMVATLAPGNDAARTVREWCGDIAALTRSVGKRVPVDKPNDAAHIEIAETLDLIDHGHCIAQGRHDLRSIIGFVDGTENPTGRKAVGFTIVGDEDPAFRGGSYVLVQKYLHNMTAWNALSTEAQERVIETARQNFDGLSWTLLYNEPIVMLANTTQTV